MGEEAVIETVEVPAHTTQRLTTDDGWVLTHVRTGCVRVQRGDFTAYFDVASLGEIAVFISDQDLRNATLSQPKEAQ
jgi:predicted N-acetyltransferase YhbS